jgi:hypothetical protein
MNNRGELMAIKITPGNTDDRAPLPDMVAGLEGKLLADKGYISQKLFAKLWKQGLHLITGIRRNMKNYLMPIMDKLLLRNVLSWRRCLISSNQKWALNTLATDPPQMPSSTSCHASRPTCSAKIKSL